jgi:hypothetical protein
MRLITVAMPEAILAPPTWSNRRLSPFAHKSIEMRIRLTNGATQLRVIVQLDAQAAKRDAEKAGGVRTIAVTAHERIENMSSLNRG